MNIVHGTFLVCGGSDAPALHVLSPAECDALWQRTGLALTSNGIRQALRHTFGADAFYALPAWSMECMAEVAESYKGADAPIVRGMAAAIALGLAGPAGPAPVTGPARDAAAPAAGGQRPRGGQPAKPRPTAPAPASPAGGFYATLGGMPLWRS